MSKEGAIIAVAGFAGSGKNTVGEKIAEALAWKIVSPTFKDLAFDEGVSLMEFQERAKKDLSIDYKFDASLARKVGAGNCVVVTWIGPWIAQISGREYMGVKIPKVGARVFSAWLDVPEEIRAGRLGNRDKMSPKEALEHIKARDAENINRYKRAYGIDITAHEGFGIVLNVGKEDSPSMLAGQIIAEAKRNGII